MASNKVYSSGTVYESTIRRCGMWWKELNNSEGIHLKITNFNIRGKKEILECLLYDSARTL